MSQDSFSDVSGQSWFSRLGSAIGGVLIGGLMFLGSFPLLFWNEGRAVQRYLSLQEGGKSVISVPADRIDPANSGKLIHVTGKVVTEATLKDPVFDVSAKALKLARNVEMYQWKEKSEKKTHKKLGGGEETVTTYTYDKDWSSRLNDSHEFKHPEGHQNPRAMPYDSLEQAADPMMLGAFKLPPSLVGKISGYVPLPIEPKTPVPESLHDSAKVQDGEFYLGKDPKEPEVGDVRISFKTVSPAVVSIIDAQAGASFAPYSTKTGGTLELLELGEHTPQEMIQTAQEGNRVLTWVLRGVGTVLMFFGINLMLKPLSVFADVVPIFGSLIGFGAGIIAALTAGSLSLMTIAIAWIFYRPLLAILLLGGGIALAVVIVRVTRRRRATTAAA